MNNLRKFALEYNKYTNKRISEENRREYTIGFIQALMVLSAIIFPMLALMLSPGVIKVSPLMLGTIFRIPDYFNNHSNWCSSMEAIRI